MHRRKLVVSTILFAFLITFVGCDDSSGVDNPDQPEPPSSCYVQLFDGDHFKDDSIIIEGAGEFSDLANLRGSDGKDWTDEADSFIAVVTTTLIIWTQTSFKGDSNVYETGKYPSVDEPYSLKITCGNGCSIFVYC